MNPCVLSDGSPPFSILDAGCGIGVLGICALGALQDFALPGKPGFQVRCQDRDELARIFTEYNAERNGLSKEILTTHAEPLLSAPAGQSWDLILCNIPAKAGQSVLEDFIRRSAAMLKKGGRVFLVAVNPLSDFFRSKIAVSASLLSEESGKEHTVFVFGKNESQYAEQAAKQSAILFDESFPQSYPFYIRNKGEYEMEGITYRLDTVHGAPDFDSPGGEAAAAAKLAIKIGLAAKLGSNKTVLPMLIHDAGQGHFALWLNYYLEAADFIRRNPKLSISIIVSGRNVAALAAARAALNAAGSAAAFDLHTAAVPSADIEFDSGRLAAEIATDISDGQVAHNGNGFSFIAFFPESVPQTSRFEAAWEGLTRLAATDCIIIAGMDSAEAERFDRKKASAWQRLADVRRKGFRAMAYSKREV